MPVKLNCQVTLKEELHVELLENIKEINSLADVSIREGRLDINSFVSECVEATLASRRLARTRENKGEQSPCR